MPYATLQQLEDVWGAAFVTGLLPEDVDAGTAIGQALVSASDEIDLHLSARYTLPLAVAPRALITPASNIAVYILANHHSALTETIKERYNQTVELLKRIAEGKAGLGADEPSVPSDDPNASAGGAAFTADRRLFGRNTQ